MEIKAADRNGIRKWHFQNSSLKLKKSTLITAVFSAIPSYYIHSIDSSGGVLRKKIIMVVAGRVGSPYAEQSRQVQ